ncbi:MAG: hypothetical protein UY50_C0025G0033 [Parcubacteria group bacterium GW2011_GWA2_49_9]|nr:MAG: hypothetical protein UY50_C0025G0033 [Parcubacteria group bacterium GW2011_GWA2_49_9]
MVLGAFVGGRVTKEVVFGNNASKTVNHFLKLREHRLLLLVADRLANTHQGVVLNLTDTFPCNAILLSNGFKCHLLR